MKHLKILFLSSIVMLFTACGGGGGSSVGTIPINPDTTQSVAIEKIMAYADDSTLPAPTVEDYIDAGVTGVTSENINDVNEVVENLTEEDVDTTEEIQKIVDDLGINILPTAAAGPDKSTEVNKEVTITGTGTDIDGYIVSYVWTKDSVVLATTASFNYIPTAVGTDTLTLTVTDDDGATSTDTVNITVNILHNEIAYGTITSPVTGKIWLDRNLGANSVCTSFEDDQCYGDYYQWGRETDGHEKKDSVITEIQSSSVIVGHGDFISRPTVSGGGGDPSLDYLVIFSDGTEMTITDGNFTPVSQYLDWTTGDIDGTNRSADWNPCPSAYRMPTISELHAEDIVLSTDALDNLKLAGGGYRQADGLFTPSDYFDKYGYYWSSNYGEYKLIIPPDSSYSWPVIEWEEDSVKGMHVRCIQE